MDSEKFQNFHFQAQIVIFERNIIKMITSVNSGCLRIHTLYMDFAYFLKMTISMMEHLRENPEIYPSYHFCDFSVKMTF